MSLPPLHTGTGGMVTVVKLSNGGYHLMPNYKQKSTESVEPTEPKDHTVDKNIQHLHSYWVNYRPKDASHDSGIMCRARVKATDGIDALRRVAHVMGCAVYNAERIIE